MLARRKAPKMNVRQDTRYFPGFLAFVRLHVCSVPGCENQDIEASHIRKGIPAHEAGGVGMKPHDKWTCPKCRCHHQEYHDLGHDTFEAKYGISLVEVCKDLQRRWPNRKKWETAE